VEIFHFLGFILKWLEWAGILKRYFNRTDGPKSTISPTKLHIKQTTFHKTFVVYFTSSGKFKRKIGKINSLIFYLTALNWNSMTMNWKWHANAELLQKRMILNIFFRILINGITMEYSEIQYMT
jgi:hypothetical protein